MWGELLFTVGGCITFFTFVLLLSSIKQINEYQRGVLYTMGRFSGVVGSGWKVIIPVLQKMVIVDIRTKTVDLADQGGMTADNVSIKIGAVVFFNVSDAGKAINEVENYKWAVSQLAETTIRTVVGETTLQNLLTGREEVANKIEHIIAPKSEIWGMKIVGVELKDIVLPEDMKRTMAKQAEAEREKLAVITKAEGELEASDNLSKAAANMASTPGALHLRTLSTLNDLSSDQSNTIIFAIPVEVLRAIDGMGSETVGKMVKKMVSKK